MKLTAERLRELLDYNPETGVFTWRVARAYVVKPGDIAGSLKWKRNRYHRVIIVDGRECQEHTLAWLFSRGEWPRRPVVHIDGDCTNNRASNLTIVEAISNELTPERIRELLEYDPQTGILTWKVAKAQCAKPGSVAATATNAQGYQHVKIDGKTVKSHRIAWAHYYGVWPDDQIDHINGDRSDNRISNLRSAQHAENARNRQIGKNNKSGVKGVYWHVSNKKWHAQIRAHGVRHSLGFYDDIEHAADAYRKASERLHGEFGRT